MNGSDPSVSAEQDKPRPSDAARTIESDAQPVREQSPKAQHHLVFEGAWILNGIALVATFLWLISDGYLSRVRWPAWKFLGFDLGANSSPVLEGLSLAMETPRLRIGMLIATICIATWCIMLLGFAFRSRRYRSVRAVLMLTANVACWLVLVTGWSGIIHWGMDWKVSQSSRTLQGFAEKTYRDWELLTDPNASLSEGVFADTPWIPFNAYPLRKPRMIFFLGEQPIPGTAMAARSIERTEGEAIRLELSGNQLGNWLEWRVNSDSPTDFTGGLDTPMQVNKWRKIADHLFIVQYR